MHLNFRIITKYQFFMGKSQYSSLFHFFLVEKSFHHDFYFIEFAKWNDELYSYIINS